VYLIRYEHINVLRLANLGSYRVVGHFWVSPEMTSRDIA
jgi:hypothetical protein